MFAALGEDFVSARRERNISLAWRAPQFPYDDCGLYHSTNSAKPLITKYGLGTGLIRTKKTTLMIQVIAAVQPGIEVQIFLYYYRTAREASALVI